MSAERTIYKNALHHCMGALQCLGKRQTSSESVNKTARESFVDALYNNRTVAVSGTLTGLLVSLCCYLLEQDLNYFLFFAAFGLTGFARVVELYFYSNFRESRSLKQWEAVALLTGVVQGVLLGAMTIYAYYEQNAYAELLTTCLSIGNLVSLPSRNYGSIRLVRWQLIVMSASLATAFLIKADIKYWFGIVPLIPLFWSVTKSAQQMRDTVMKLIDQQSETDKVLKRFDTATRFMQHGFVIIDEQLRVTHINTRALKLLSLDEDGKWLGNTYDQLLENALENQRFSQMAAQDLSLVASNSDAQVSLHKVVVKTTNEHYLESSTSVWKGQTAILLEDVTDRILSADRMAYMATRDSLTGLCNREHFHDLFTQSLEEPTEEKCMLMVIDLDDFKYINDTYGHATGDELLCSAAATIERHCAEFAIPCRFGGDEFVIFAPAIKDERQIEEFPKRLLAALSDKVQLTNCHVRINASIGLVVERQTDACSDAMFAKADIALYESKEKLRGGYTIFGNALTTSHTQRQRMKDALSLAVERNELSADFQPIVCLKTGKVKFFEALSRWRHPKYGMVSPAEFIPLSETMNLVHKITATVLQKSIYQCSKWPEDIGVSVNLSSYDFDTPDLVESIHQMLLTYGLAPQRLELEITEGTFIENMEKVSDIADRLQAIGVKIALDDFGSGYSNFSYLQKVNFDKLKIDRCFVTDIDQNPRSQVLLSGIAAIGQDLGMQITVEGVETAAQLQVMHETEVVDYIQGWCFSKAVRAEESNAVALRIYDVNTGKHCGESVQRSA